METKASASHRLYIFALLIFVGGFIGGFTNQFRGGVFCNAQTGNMLIMSIALVKGNFTKVGYCLVSFVAYVIGAVLSEYAVSKNVQVGHLKCETLLIGCETVVLAMLAFVPESAPFVITHIPLSMMAAMQYNTFKKMGDIGMATTFITNHTRNMGVNLEKLMVTHDGSYIKRASYHLLMIFCFCFGAGAATWSGNLMSSACLWIIVAILAFVFVVLVMDDVKRGSAAKA